MQIARGVQFIPQTPLGLLSALFVILLSTPPALALPKNTVVATIPTGIPGDIIVSPDSKTVYVTNNDTNTVQFIDTRLIPLLSLSRWATYHSG